MNFEPFVGDEYSNGFRHGLKLLLLGESHYQKDPPYDPAIHDLPAYTLPFTTRVVKEDFLGMTDGRSSFENKFIWGRLHRMLTGKEDPTKADAMDAWSRIAYGNYIQHFVGKDAKAQKRAWHWESGKKALPELLEQLAPDRVLVFGKTTWNYLNNTGDKWLSESWAVDGQKRGLWGLSSQDRLIPTTWIYHPSWGRDSVQKMRAVLNALMAFR